MRAYVMDSFKRYKRFSEQLDVKAVLCNKSWWVFNDSGEKEIYIFQEDGSLIISLNGNVINANWKYIPANQSLIINAKEQSYMLHPTFLDEKVFALQKDGTELYSFMIIEEQLQLFKPKSLSDLNSYFEHKRLTEIEEEQKRHQMQRELERQKYLEEVETKKRRKQQEAELERENTIQKEIDETLNKNIIYMAISIIAYIQIFATPIILFVCFYNEILAYFQKMSIITKVINGLSFASLGVIIFIVISLLILMPIHYTIEKRIRKKYQNKSLKNRDESETQTKKEVEFESIDELEARIEKKKQDDFEKQHDRIQEENKRKEWTEYLKQRDQRDFERIERYRIEREKKEKNRKI